MYFSVETFQPGYDPCSCTALQTLEWPHETKQTLHPKRRALDGKPSWN